MAANAFFVAAEFALVAVDRTRLQGQADEGGRRARVAVALIRRLSFHLSGAQLGITVTSLVLGFVAEPAVAAVIEPAVAPLVGGASAGVSIALALALATVFQMVLGELVPKSVAIARPLRTSVLLAPAVRVYGAVFGPVITFLDGAANWTVRRLGIEPREELPSVRSLPELELLFEASAEEGTLDAASTRLLSRAVRFRDKTAADLLVPRVEIDAVSRETTAAELVERARETGRSRFPVFGADLDDIVGVVHVKSVHAVPPDRRTEVPVTELMADVPAVPESIDAESLLFALQEARTHLLVVVDEFGGTAGIATLEDVVEEIVGEIDDEYDQPPTALTVVERPGELVLAGSLHADEVFDASGFGLPEGDYETLAGFLLDRLGHIPREPGATVEHEGWRLTVTELDGLRIAAVRLLAPPDEGTGPEGEHTP